MAELITEVSDEELVTKLKAKRRIRGLLIAINFVLFGYLAFNIGASIVDLVDASKRVEGLVPLKDKSPKESLEIYKQYIKSDEDVIGGDFAIYGDYILFTKGNFDIDNLDLYENVQLAKVQENKNNLVKDISLNYVGINQYFNTGVNIFYDNSKNALPLGDYFFYIDSVGINDMGKILKINNGLEMEYVNYSLPDKDGRRVKSTIYAYKDNPAFVMNIDYVYGLPEGYIDALVIGSDEDYQKVNTKINELLPNAKIERVDSASYDQAYEYKARTIIKLVDEDTTNNEDVSYTWSKFENSGGKDDDFILAMAGYANSKGYPTQFKSEHFAGKMTYIIDVKN